MNKERENPFDDISMVFNEDFYPDEKTSDLNRYIHVDLGGTGDACGFSMCHITHMVEIIRETTDKEGVPRKIITRSPYAVFDFVGRMFAPEGKEFIGPDVLDLIFEIVNRGFIVNLVTFDGWQSSQLITMLREEGITSSTLSIDHTAKRVLVDPGSSDKFYIKKESTDRQYLAAYECVKEAMYEERLDIPEHEFFEIECLSAELDSKRNKIIHNVRGSIDMLQSIAGSLYNATNNETVFFGEKELDFEDDSAFYNMLDSNGFTTKESVM